MSTEKINKTKMEELIESVNRLTEFTYDIQKLNKTGNMKSIAVDFNDLLNTITFLRLLKATHTVETELDILKKQLEQEGLKESDCQLFAGSEELLEEDHF